MAKKLPKEVRAANDRRCRENSARINRVDVAAKRSMENKLTKAIEDIWGYVRLNRGSLDSERACKIIREAVDIATDAVAGAMDDVIEQNTRLKKELKFARKQLKEARAATHEYMEAYFREVAGVA